MTYDERQFLDLLLEYKSDETKKARRNTSVVAFVLISLWATQIPILKLSVLGVPSTSAGVVPILTIAFVLLLYWTIMFVLTWIHDDEIQKERTIILDAQVKSFTARFEQMEKERSEGTKTHYLPDYHPIKAMVEAHTKQQARVGKAKLFVTIVRRMELLVPLALSFCAHLVLLRWAIDAL